MVLLRFLGSIWRWYTHPRPGRWLWLGHSIFCATNLCAAWYLCPSWAWSRHWSGDQHICADMKTWGWTFIPILLCVWLSGQAFACSCIELERWLRWRRIESAEFAEASVKSQPTPEVKGQPNG